MRAWLDRLEPRQRLLVIVGAVALSVLLLWLLAIQPLFDRLHTLERTVAAQKETLRWMQEAAIEIQQLRSQGSRAGDLGGRSLLAVVDQSARAAGLGPGIRRVEPDGESRVRVRMEGVAFDALMRWLAELHRRYGVRVTSVSIDRESSPGRVNVRLTLEA